MAGGKRYKRGIRRNKVKVVRTDTRKDVRGSYEEIVKENEDFVKYYKAQGIVKDEEWDDFMASLRTDLPTAFRIMGASSAEAQRLLDIVRGEFFRGIVNADVGVTKREPSCFTWYPNNLGWQLEISRKDIRRCESYFRLHNFLTSETATGAISRQEAVSMIPPLLLDIKSHHKVLDMCAAPGSKTAQLIELLHSGCEDKIPEGVVIANDIDNSRCYMLVHQAKRLNSPCIVITNHDSGAMPNFTTTEPDGSEGVLKFDRILCDAPCSGDGTLRKNPDIWRKWNTANGNNLHGVQYRILKRGVEMLEIGGKIVYSTCSLNPVENEAVVHRLLSESDGSLELIGAADRLPGLTTEAGATVWRPASRDMTTYDRYDEVDEKWRTQVRPSMFPPAVEDAKRLNLERCIRILPHRQDTGGFFVAVIVKNSRLPWESGPVRVDPNDPQDPNDPNPKDPNPDGTRRGPQERKRRKMQGYREDPYVFFKDDEPVWTSIRDFYEVDNLDPKCLLTRCTFGKKKNIYFVSPRVKEIVDQNQTRIKIINTGVKVFSRCDNKSMFCCFRLVQEGLESIRTFVGPKRRLEVTKEDLISLLERNDPKEPCSIEFMSERTKQLVEDISQGSCVLTHSSDGMVYTLVGWRGTKSLRAYVPVQDSVHFLRLLGADVSKFEVNKFKKEESALEEVKNGGEAGEQEEEVN